MDEEEEEEDFLRSDSQIFCIENPLVSCQR